MEKCENKVGNLILNSFLEGSSSKANANLLILGNAYGIMPYQIPLAEELTKRGFNSWWFPFRGQEGSPGIFSGDSGVEDIKEAISFISKEHRGSFYILAHCASGLFALKYLQKYPCSPIEKISIYGLLYNPGRRRKIAEPKLKKSGVKYSLSELWWNIDPVPILKQQTKPILFCHAKDSINLDRGTESEMDLVTRVTPNSKIMWFEKGYDNNFESIQSFVDVYCNWFLQKQLL